MSNAEVGPSIYLGGTAMNRKERRASAKLQRSGQGQGAASAKVEQAITLAQAGNFEAAEPLLDAARRLSPDDPEAMHQLGMIYVRTGRANSGIALLKQATEKRPQEYIYWNNLTAAYLSVEMSKEA